MTRRSSIGATMQALNTEFPTTISPDSPNCALSAAGGRCDYVSKQMTTNGAGTEDLFTVTGQVRIIQVYGIVTAEAEGPNTTFSNCKFSIYDQTNTVDMCTVVNASGIEVADVLIKQADDGTAMVWMDTDNAEVYSEAGTFRRAFFEGVAAKKEGAATYVRFSYTGDGTTDVTMTFYIRWQPLSAGSSLVAT